MFCSLERQVSRVEEIMKIINLQEKRIDTISNYLIVSTGILIFNQFIIVLVLICILLGHWVH